MQETLEFIVEQDHSLRMKVPLLHLILTTSRFDLIPMFLPLRIKILSWIAFMRHTFLKVPLLLTMSYTGHTILRNGDTVIVYCLEERGNWGGVLNSKKCNYLMTGA